MGFELKKKLLFEYGTKKTVTIETFLYTGAFASCSVRDAPEDILIINIVVLPNDKETGSQVRPSTENGRKKAKGRKACPV